MASVTTAFQTPSAAVDTAPGRRSGPVRLAEVGTHRVSGSAARHSGDVPLQHHDQWDGKQFYAGAAWAGSNNWEAPRQGWSWAWVRSRQNNREIFVECQNQSDDLGDRLSDVIGDRPLPHFGQRSCEKRTDRR